MKEITLLCRGKSLGYINKIPKAEHCVLVNAFHYELENSSIHEYVFNCSKVSHVLSLGAYFPQSGARNIYKKYNFIEIILPYIKEVSPPIPKYLSNIEGKNGIIPVKNMSNINKKNMISHPRYAFTSPTCGLDALLYIVNELKPSIVNIIGLDFYDKVGYLTDSNGRSLNEAPDDKAIRWGESTQKMQEFFIKFVKDNLDTQFNLHTLSNIKDNNPNLNVIKFS